MGSLQRSISADARSRQRAADKSPEIEMEIQKYQVERAYQNTQLARGRSPAQPQQPLQIGIVQNWK